MSAKDAKVIAILGASGFIGRALRREFRKSHELLLIDLQAPREEPSGASESFMRADLGEPEDLANVMGKLESLGNRLAAVIVLAAYYDFRDSPNPKYDRLQEGIQGLSSRLCAVLPPHVVFVFASSMASMAPTEPGRKLTHESPRWAGWYYPRYKLKAERSLENIAPKSALPIVQLVLAGVYSDDCELVPLYHTIKLVRGNSPEKFFYPGPTDRGLTYVHVEDVARAFRRAVETVYDGPGVYRCLIGEGSPLTYAAIHELVSRVFHGRRLPLIRIPKFIAWMGAALLAGIAALRGKRRFIQPWMIRFAGEHFEFDVRNTRDLIGWQATRRLEEELPAVLERARANRAEFDRKNEARPW